MKYQQTRTETEFRSLACSSTDHKQLEEREQGNQSERHTRDEPIRYSPGVGVERRESFENKALKVWPTSAQTSPFPADSLPPWLWFVASQPHMPPRSQRVVQVFIISLSFPNPVLSSNPQPHNVYGIFTVGRHVAHHRILCYILPASHMLSQDYSHLAITLVPAENGSQTKTAAQGIMRNLLFKCNIFQSNSHQLPFPLCKALWFPILILLPVHLRHDLASKLYRICHPFK